MAYDRKERPLRRVSVHPKLDARELFRRIAFNALISNLDDHPRNHAVIAMDNDRRLSPAYDLTPSAAVSLERRVLPDRIFPIQRFLDRMGPCRRARSLECSARGNRWDRPFLMNSTELAETHRIWVAPKHGRRGPMAQWRAVTASPSAGAFLGHVPSAI